MISFEISLRKKVFFDCLHSGSVELQPPWSAIQRLPEFSLVCKHFLICAACHNKIRDNKHLRAKKPAVSGRK
jgi:hypothetical protein